MRLKPKPKEITEKEKAILEMRKQGKSIVEIGKIFNCSRQRVFQILQKYGDPLDKT